MTTLLDASVLVRYLTGDPPDDARRVAKHIDSREPFTITSGAIAETGFVLRSRCQMPREAIIDSLIGLIGRSNIDILDLDKGLVAQALLLCRPSNRVSIPDAMLWATARVTGLPVYTLDQRFPTDSIEVRGV